MSNDPTTLYPGIGPGTGSDDGRDPLDRMAEEFAERCRNGEAPSIAEYEARDPEQAPRIRKLLEAVAMMEQFRRDAIRSRPIPERLGEYRIIRELGRGGMGVVYEAEQESLGRRVAVKAIHHVQMDVKRLRRFRLEAQAIARLHHTNIVPIFGVGEDDGLPYYAMQYINGSGLDVLLDAWRRGEAPPAGERWRLIAEIGIQAAEALHYAHEQGVLHRDIKPANLLLDEHRAVWITDFGLAKLVGGEDLTASGDVIGTLRYLAPESLRGVGDARSDLYSLGLTLYELITREVPFGEVSPSELLRQVSEGTLPLPRRAAPTLPRDLETIILKAIAHEPDHRYRSAHALADDLRRYLEDRPIRARRATSIERAWRWGRRNKATAALMATAAASLVLAAVVGGIGYVNTNMALARLEAVNQQSEANVKLSLDVFGKLFEKLAPPDQILSTPLGMMGRWRHPGPPDGLGPVFGRPPRGGDLGPRGGPRPDGGFGPGPGPPPDGPSGGRPGRRGGGARRDGEPGPTHGEDRRPPDGPPGGPRFASPEADTSLLDSVLMFYERFAGQNAETRNPKLQGEAAWAYRKVGALYHNLGQEDQAERAYARAISMFEQLIAQGQADADARFKLVATYLTSVPWSADASTLEQAERRMLRARELIAGLPVQPPKDEDDTRAIDHYKARLQVGAKLGITLQRLGRTKEAEGCLREVVDLVGTLIERLPAFTPWRLDRIAILEALAELQIADGRREEALKGLAAARDDLRSIAERSRRPMSGPRLDHYERLATLYEMLDEAEQAGEMNRLADELASRRDEDRMPPPDEGGPDRGDHERMRPRPPGEDPTSPPPPPR